MSDVLAQCQRTLSQIEQMQHQMDQNRATFAPMYLNLIRLTQNGHLQWQRDGEKVVATLAGEQLVFQDGYFSYGPVLAKVRLTTGMTEYTQLVEAIKRQLDVERHEHRLRQILLGNIELPAN